MTKPETSLLLKGMIVIEKVVKVTMLGDVDAENIKMMPYVLTGTFDLEMKHAILWHKVGVTAPTEAQLEDTWLLGELEFVKARVRNFIQGVIDAASEQEAQERMQHLTQVKIELQQRNKPHELGTVAELAIRFGVSKSEIRRRKAAGTLHELKES